MICPLHRLYGQHDLLIREWIELLKQHPADEPHLRRGIVSLYRDKRARNWAQMPLEELRHVEFLMSRNLDADPANERDLRSWFQAYKRLPEFTYSEALSKLASWAARSDALDAHYYLHILHFIRWYRGEELKIDETLRHQAESVRKSSGLLHADHAYEWLAKGDDPCPLVHFRELGPRGGQDEFYEGSEELLFRYTGKVAKIEPPRRGWITIAQGLQAFCNSRKLFKGLDEGQDVNFYLGFTYEGLRAYDPEPGKGPPLPRDRVAQHRATAGGGDSALHRRTHKDDERPTEESRRELLRKRVEKFIQDLVAAADARGKTLDKGVLGSRLNEEFPGPPVHEQLRLESLSDLLAQIRGVTVEASGKTQVVRLSRPPADGAGAGKTMQVPLRSTEAVSPPPTLRSSVERVRGVTKIFFEKKGYGFVATSDGREAMVHFSDIIGSGFKALNSGEEVEFDIVPNNDRWVARRVQRLANQPSEHRAPTQ